jgi:hypothetical protein
MLDSLQTLTNSKDYFKISFRLSCSVIGHFSLYTVHVIAGFRNNFQDNFILNNKISKKSGQISYRKNGFDF